MGLNFLAIGFLKPTAKWSYSGFYVFRKNLANHLGFDLHEMKGYYKGNILNPIFGTKTWESLVEEIPEVEPLLAFFNHSDCDGVISPEECKKISPSLLELIETKFHSTTYCPVTSYDYNQGLILVEMMQHCVRNNVDLQFS